jgi:DNA-damage-inducible protein J
MTTLNVRIDQKTKTAASKILSKVGLDMSSAVKVFLSQVITEGGLPFTPSSLAQKKRAGWDKAVEAALKDGKSFKTAKEALRGL